MPIALIEQYLVYHPEAKLDTPMNMASHEIMGGQNLRRLQNLNETPKEINFPLPRINKTLFSHFDTDDFPPDPPAPSAIPVGHVDLSEHLPPMQPSTLIHRTDLTDITAKYAMEIKKENDIKFETLRNFDQDSLLEMDSHMSEDHSLGSHEEDLADISQRYILNIKQEMPSSLDISSTNGIIDSSQQLHNIYIKEEIGIVDSSRQLHHVYIKEEIDQMTDHNEHNMDQVDAESTNGHLDSGPNTPRTSTGAGSGGGGPKTWTQEDMDMALDALKNHNMSLTKASATYGIPSTTLWQRAHRLGIDTPKKEGPTKSWTEENLNNALEALRTGQISANKASKAYGIPSSTLYKIARREGIKLAAPFNAAPTTWTPDDLEKALESIRTGQTSVQKASTEFGIPTGTLYGRCKREGIELSRSNPTPWSEDAMGEALEAVRLGHMSINQAAIHYNLPYSSLYGRFKRGIKYDSDNIEISQETQAQLEVQNQFQNVEFSNSQQIQYQNLPNS